MTIQLPADSRSRMFQVSTPLSGEAGRPVVTGTPLYAAISVLMGQPNSVSSDLESLFYTLVDIGELDHMIFSVMMWF